MTTVFTVGHSSRSLEELVGLLREHGIDALVDVRRFPHSRTNPQFDEERLAPILAAAGITYLVAPALGGRRGRKDSSEDAIALQSGWEVAAFRAYAAYATTAAFREALSALEDLASRSRCALMCSEALWWRCHRRIVADYLLAAGVRVRHILGPGELQEGALTPFAREGTDGTLLYGPA
ncbi:MAG TPA: DUF488 domain-containing protein [Polyangiaceae bacterium]